MSGAFYFPLRVSLKIFPHVVVFYFQDVAYFRPARYRDGGGCIFFFFYRVVLLLDTGLSHVASWCCDSAAMKGADRKNVRPARKVLRKRWFGGLSPFLCCPGKWSGLNRISILIGRKYATTITVKLIYAPNKNTKFFLLQELRPRMKVWST